MKHIIEEESKYAASAKAFRANVTRDLGNEELRSNFRGAMDYLISVKALFHLLMNLKSYVNSAN